MFVLSHVLIQQTTFACKQWDALCHENVITETAHIATGSSETNYINLLQVHTIPELSLNI